MVVSSFRFGGWCGSTRAEDGNDVAVRAKSLRSVCPSTAGTTLHSV
jgi:hypothetical protein